MKMDLKVVLVLVVSLFSLTSASLVVTNLAYLNRPVITDLFGINFNWWVRSDVYKFISFPSSAVNSQLPYNNTYLLQFFNATQSRILRYPGGTTGTFWNHSSNYFVDINSQVCQTMEASTSVYTTRCSGYTAANTSNIAYFPANYLNPQAFGEAMHAAGIEWIFVANLYTLDPQVTIDVIDSLCSPGNVACPTYLELGNEYYLSNFFPTGLMPNSTVYINRIAPVYNATTKYFNSSIAGLTDITGFSTSSTTASAVKWMNGLYNQSGKAFDHLTVHSYSLKPKDFRLTGQWSWYTMMLTWPETVIRASADDAAKKFPGVQLWMTEFNFGAAQGLDSTIDAAYNFSADQRWQPSHGLNVAGWYLSMMKYPDIYTKAWLFESLKDNYLSAFQINTTGTYAYAPGQIFSHLSYIMKMHRTFAYISFANVDQITGISPWFNGWTGTLNALQGALFYGGDFGLTYVIMNRVNYSIQANLTQTSPYLAVTVYEYIGNETIVEPAFKIDINNPPSFPWAGPIPVKTTPTQPNNGYYVATFAPFSLQVLWFQWHYTPSTTSSSDSGTTATSDGTTATSDGTTTTSDGTTATSDGTTTSPDGTTAETTTTSSTDNSTSTSGSEASTSGSEGATSASPTTTSASTTSGASVTVVATLLVTGNQAQVNTSEIEQAIASTLGLTASSVSASVSGSTDGSGQFKIVVSVTFTGAGLNTPLLEAEVGTAVATGAVESVYTSQGLTLNSFSLGLQL